jgi:hypothetical protein
MYTYTWPLCGAWRVACVAVRLNVVGVRCGVRVSEQGVSRVACGCAVPQRYAQSLLLCMFACSTQHTQLPSQRSRVNTSTKGLKKEGHTSIAESALHTAAERFTACCPPCPQKLM